MTKEELAFVRTASGLVRNVSAFGALTYNFMMMGIYWTFVYLIWGPALYPGVDYPLTILIGLVPGIFIATLYVLMSIAMPRSGGDYIWVSRTLHPALGFMCSFYFAFVCLTWIGTVTPWGATFGLRFLFNGLGVVTGDQTYFSLATAVAQTGTTVIISAVIILFLLFVASRGTKASFRLWLVTFIFVMIGLTTYLVVVLSAGHETFAARLNSATGLNMQEVINAAKAEGFVPGFTLQATLLGSVYSFLNYIGYNSSAYIAGEIKDVRRSQVLAIIGSLFLFAAVMYIIALSTYSVFGWDFYPALVYLFGKGSPSYTLLMDPIGLYLASYVTNSPLAIILMFLGFISTVFGAILVVIYWPVRVMFAWAFDRVLPAKLAAVDTKYKTPYVALLTTGLIGIVFLLLGAYTNAFTYMLYSITGWFIATVIVGVAGAAFPYRRKDLFNAAPPIVKSMVGPVPLVTILGIITAITGTFVAAATLWPAYAGTVVPTYAVAVILMLLAGPIIYYVGSAYQKSRGIPVGMAFKEIPPE